MLAHDQRRLLHAHALGGHDLIGLGVLQHAVLMDAELVRERIPADDRLVVLHGKRGRGCHQLRCAGEHRAVDIGPVRHHVVAYLHRHHDLLECGVTGTLADAVDRALDLTDAGPHAGEGVRHCHAEIVMTVHGQARLIARSARGSGTSKREYHPGRCSRPYRGC